ncbi:unnamed protein product, partial [Effrenium voratum]
MAMMRTRTKSRGMCLCLLGIALALLVQPSTAWVLGHIFFEGFRVSGVPCRRRPGLCSRSSWAEGQHIGPVLRVARRRKQIALWLFQAKRHPLHAGVARRAGAAQEDNSGQDWRDLEEAADQRMRAEFVEEDLLLARQQLQFALEEQETAQAQVATAQEQVATAQEQVATAQEQEAIAVRRLARAEESGDAKKVQAAERKVQAAERKVQVAERKVERAKKEVEKAERKVERAKKEVKEAKASGRTKESEVDIAEALAEMLFNTTDTQWPLVSAKYSAASSSIIDLSRGAFRGVLPVGKEDKAQLLDRQEEVAFIVQQLKMRADDLKGRMGTDKRASPAMVVAQAPGSGKSHFLAKLGEQLPSLYDLEGNNQTPIVSAFTYNSGMSTALKHESGKTDVLADLALRIIYGAARHMTENGCQCCSWDGFLHELRSARRNEILATLRSDPTFAVKLLRNWYGARPLVILADEVGKSEDEAAVRHCLCNSMDTWGGQAFVVMSALSEYDELKAMFNGSQRDYHILALRTLDCDTFRLFSAMLQKLNDKQNASVKRNILEYRIALAWGTTGGYARAVEILAEYIGRAELGAGLVLKMALDHLAKVNHPLPPSFTLEVLEEVLAVWEDDSRMFSLDKLLAYSARFAKAIYTGSVLLESLQLGAGYYPTVASWHAAQLFCSPVRREKELLGILPRCRKLMEMAGQAYKSKVAAVNQDEELEIIKQASAYLTEVAAAFGVMIAIVKKYEKLPPALLQGACQSICDIGFDDSLAQKSDLATRGEEDAPQKLKEFLKQSQARGRNQTQPFLLIMAPQSCQALDFVIYCKDKQALVAVQVKSDTPSNRKAKRRQLNKLKKAAQDLQECGTDMLAVVASESAELGELQFRCLQLSDIRQLVPPFLRHLSGLAAGFDAAGNAPGQDDVSSKPRAGG